MFQQKVWEEKLGGPQLLHQGCQCQAVKKMAEAVQQHNSGHFRERSDLGNIIGVKDFAKQEGIEHIDLLKIDTEGFEMPVLRGAVELLDAQAVSAVICETGFMRANTRNTYFGDINDFLEAKGFALFGIYEMGHLGFKVGRHCGNLLYVSKKYRDTQYRNWQV